jgi:hypothetical protein
VNAQPIVVPPGEGARVGNVEFLARSADTPRFTFGAAEWGSVANPGAWSGAGVKSGWLCGRAWSRGVRYETGLYFPKRAGPLGPGSLTCPAATAASGSPTDSHRLCNA